MAGILIVDDDPTIRAMFARALASIGEVEQAGSGAEALRLLGAKKFGIVLLDLHMPVIDGFVILHTLTTKPGPNRDTPVYVITADVSEHARLRALQHHAVFLLTKPVPIATLTALVDSVLKKAAARAATTGPSAGRPAPPIRSVEGGASAKAGARPEQPVPPVLPTKKPGG
jgi:CheY-like chemotaxis protein